MARDDAQKMWQHAEYAATLSVQDDDALSWIQSEAGRQDLPTISVNAYDGKLLQFLVMSVGARRVVEIDTLAGYSGTWIARALPEDGKLYTLEKSSKHAAVARRSFEHAGLAHKVEILEGAALDMLNKLAARTFRFCVYRRR